MSQTVAVAPITIISITDIKTTFDNSGVVFVIVQPILCIKSIQEVFLWSVVFLNLKTKKS